MKPRAPGEKEVGRKDGRRGRRGREKSNASHL